MRKQSRYQEKLKARKALANQIGGKAWTTDRKGKRVPKPRRILEAMLEEGDEDNEEVPVNNT